MLKNLQPQKQKNFHSINKNLLFSGLKFRLFQPFETRTKAISL